MSKVKKGPTKGLFLEISCKLALWDCQIKQIRCSGDRKKEYDRFLSCPEQHWIADEVGGGFQGSRNGVVNENVSREGCDQIRNSNVKECVNNP